MFLSENNNYCDIKIQLEDEYKFFIKLEIFNSDYELIELPAMLGNSYSFRIKKSVYVLRT